MVDAAARAAGRRPDAGVVMRRGRSTLVRFEDVVARVRFRADRAIAERELAVGRTLAAADVPAVRPIDIGHRPADVGDYVITLWRWIDGLGHEAEPAAIGRLAAELHRSTAARSARASIPKFDPLAATRVLLTGDESADTTLLATVVDGLVDPWSEVQTTDPLGAALVHGDLHAENVLATAEGPVLVDLELTGVGPPSYDAAPMAIAVKRYGADPSSLDAFVRSWPADPRSWAGFDVCCLVYEAWVAAWAVSQAEESPAAAEEAAIRMATLRGEPSRTWRLR